MFRRTRPQHDYVSFGLGVLPGGCEINVATKIQVWLGTPLPPEFNIDNIGFDIAQAG